MFEAIALPFPKSQIIIYDRPRIENENQMPKRRAISKLQAILLIDLIIISVATAGYYYIQPQFERATPSQPLKPATFQVTNLIINPSETGVNQPIAISANVTNVGDETGSYSIGLEINTEIMENKTGSLSGGESAFLEFTVTEAAVGTYTVKLGSATGTFNVVAASTGTRPSAISGHDLVINPSEAWPGDSVKISGQFTNYGDASGYFLVPLRINGETKDSKEINLSGGTSTTVEFTVSLASVGTYSVKLGALSGTLNIVPSGTHTLKIDRTYHGGTDLYVTIDGGSYVLPCSVVLSVGFHTISAPENFQTRAAIYKFVKWMDGVYSPTRTINLKSPMTLILQYVLSSGTQSCPSLFVWDGTQYVYRAEVSSGTGYLGIPDSFRQDYSLGFLYSDPWDYIKLDKTQLQPRNGYYEMTMDQLWNELFYIDAAKLVVVDHPPGTDVFSTMGTYLYNLDEQGTIYTVSKNLAPPVSAVNIFNGAEENVLSQISTLDGSYTADYGDFHWKTLELNLGNLAYATDIKLVVAGITVYSPGQTQGEWAAQFWNQPGVMPFPPPYMEVKAANGSWVPVPDNRQFPLVDVTDDEFVVNLTGLFPTNDYSLRINTFFNVRWDYIGVDTTTQQNVTIQQILPSYAELKQISVANSNPTSSGNFTRYGNVTELVNNSDDMFVIGRQGDSVVLQFNTAAIAPVPEGMERDYFFFAKLWFKVDGLPYLSFTVDPLPFSNMTAFPYWLPESYPYDAAHLSYLAKYNTRVIS